MPLLTQQEIRDRAYAFVKEWEGTSREKAEAQTFWNEFFAVFGITRRRVASFEEPVKKLGDNRGAIDLFWKGTLIVEHKSRGKDLTKAYLQALDYFPGIEEQDLPQYVLVSDFENFCLYDLESGDENHFTLKEFPRKIHLFGFISGYKPRVYRDEDPVNVKVAEKMAELHDELLRSGYEGHPLEVLLVRLVYCLFADDTGIFPKDHFHYFIENRTTPAGLDTGAVLATIFQTLDTPQDKRRQAIDEELAQFPYVNGHLFDESLPIPQFTGKMREILLECCRFDWGRVSPAVFGSMFQSVMNEDQRRNLGAHYTSEKNILKVVHGLFLDDLREELEKSRSNAAKLRALHKKIEQMRFLDPACGCGNFLIITYRELRLLEIEILSGLRKLSKQGSLPELDSGSMSNLDVDAMSGIELEEFPARIAEVALWLTDHQMNMKMSEEFGQTFVRLPLRKSANIRCGNALRMEWEEVAPKNDNLVILGNPPFVGKQMRTPEQNEDMERVFPGVKRSGTLDYVSAWYVKAVKFIRDTAIPVAFVSTNSITQGEQAGALWNHLLSEGVRINFAHRTFRWSNDARGKAAVFCVIIGFAMKDAKKKKLYEYTSPDAEPMEIDAKNINPYLVDAENVIADSRSKPICDVPEMLYGSKPVDNGQLLLSDEEKEDLLEKAPSAARFICRLLGSQEFINGENRWCLWLKDTSPKELREMAEVMKRVENVRQFRLKSKKGPTVKLAEVPSLFAEIRQPENDYLLVPLVSSENRRYIPMAFFDKKVILTNLCASLPNATLYHFGVLQSAMHMAWTRQVCGRLKGDYRYSNNIVYNNFPWPGPPSAEKKEKVEKAARKVIDVRAQFPDSTFADLYDPNAMPKALLDAHRRLDSAVDSCYRSATFRSELDRLQFLFALYLRYTAPLAQKPAKSPSRSSTTKATK